MAEDKIYKSAEICKIFNISKSTLFRWETEDWFPRIRRDAKGNRQYRREHIQAIMKHELKKQYTSGSRNEDIERLRKVLEKKALFRLVLENDFSGLRELENLAAEMNLDYETITQVLRYAIDNLQPTNRGFISILEFSLDVCKQMRQGMASENRV